MTPESTGRTTTPDQQAAPKKTTRARAGRRPLPPRSGRRPGESGTKDQILISALGLFASKGYSGTTIRGIADQAGVDPALVHHFFGNKDGMFKAAIASTMSVSSVFDGIEMPEAADREEHIHNISDWLGRTYFPLWEDEVTRTPMIAIYRTSRADELGSQLLRARIEPSNAKLALASGRTISTTRSWPHHWSARSWWAVPCCATSYGSSRSPRCHSRS